VTATTSPSILHSLHALCEAAPDRPVLTFVDENGGDLETLTAYELAAEAQGVARNLQASGLGAGERVLLVYPSSSDFIKAFLGCVIAGVIPVPVYPPNPATLKKDLEGFARIAARAGARVALTNHDYDRTRKLASVTAFFQQTAPRWPPLVWRRTDLAVAAPVDARRWQAPVSGDDLAFLQFTSGSTSDPKGVAVTHGNLSAELASNAEVLGLGAHARAVFWLPCYHDLGLISGLLSAVVGNGHLYLMSPLTFLRRPEVWFDVMSRVRATHTASPNFGLELAVRKTTPQMRRRWDLSAMRVVLSAAEPIVPATVERFYGAFADAGLKRDTFCPAYGLAEATASVSVWGHGSVRLDRAALEADLVVPTEDASGDNAKTYLSCGPVVKSNAAVRIIDPESLRPRAMNQIGEIWVRSPTVCSGYFELPRETQESFGATVAGEHDGPVYLRTGDLGFIYGGELYVTGRRKDLIILNGRNLYPQDIEDSIRRCHPQVRPGGVVAFSIDDPANDTPGERLALLVETRETSLNEQQLQEIARAVRLSVLTDHRVLPHTIVIGPVGLVRKTTSGKVRRRACRQAFLDGDMPKRRGVRVVDTAVARSAVLPSPRVSPEAATRQVQSAGRDH
jgi:acyl-CoA synthetase (AMP-forming)/AMP-acid ligase II